MAHDYDPRASVFAFLFKAELSDEEIQTVRDIAKLPLIVHPAVKAKIDQILAQHRIGR